MALDWSSATFSFCVISEIYGGGRYNYESRRTFMVMKSDLVHGIKCDFPGGGGGGDLEIR